MIAVVGEALTDLVIERDGRVTAVPGGAPYNVARACARLGARVAFLGALSTDRFGTLLAAQLEADGVTTDLAPRVELPTTLAVAELNAQQAARYRFYTAGTSATALGSVPLLADEHTLCTGGLALALEPTATAVLDAVSVPARHRHVFVDVNCRPQAIPDRGRYLSTVDRLLVSADVVKVSDEDLAFLRPDAEPRRAARDLLGGRTRVVLLTLGASGAIVCTESDETILPPTHVDVVDTIGAGDGFSAGFVTCWDEHAVWRLDGASHHAEVVRAAQAGVAVAAAICSRRGADPPWRADLAPWNRPDAAPVARAAATSSSPGR
jgi:fructokinase